MPNDPYAEFQTDPYAEFGGSKSTVETPIESPKEQENPNGFSIRKTLSTAASDLTAPFRPSTYRNVANIVHDPKSAFVQESQMRPKALERKPEGIIDRIRFAMAGGQPENAPAMRAPQADPSELAGHVMAAGVGGGLMKAIPHAPEIVQGGLPEAGKAAVSQVRPILSNFNLIHPARMLPDVYDAAVNVKNGFMKGMRNYGGDIDTRLRGFGAGEAVKVSDADRPPVTYKDVEPVKPEPVKTQGPKYPEGFDPQARSHEYRRVQKPKLSDVPLGPEGPPNNTYREVESEKYVPKTKPKVSLTERQTAEEEFRNAPREDAKDYNFSDEANKEMKQESSSNEESSRATKLADITKRHPIYANEANPVAAFEKDTNVVKALRANKELGIKTGQDLKNLDPNTLDAAIREIKNPTTGKSAHPKGLTPTMQKRIPYIADKFDEFSQ